MNTAESIRPCPGPLVWFDAPDSAILECAACGYMIVTGNLNDQEHAATPVIREGLAA
jgi:hypothetical protein